VLRVPLNENTLTDEEINAVIRVLKSGYLTMGRETAKFEQEFAAAVGSKNAIMVNSGSSANLLAFFAMSNPLIQDNPLPRLQPGDEVIVPTLTWATTVWPIIQIGCVPVFIDCDPLTLQVRPEAVQQAITEKTRAICVVSVLGNTPDISAIKAIAKQENLWLIEDACESLGVKFNQKCVGTWGDFGTYSFFFSHHMTTIEGGMVVTDNDALADILRAMRAHGWVRQMQDKQKYEALYPDIDPRFLFVSSGFNLRPTEINAVIGQVQLKKLPAFNKKRNAVAAHWSHCFAALIQQGKLTPMVIGDSVQAAWFGYPILCADKTTRDQLRQHLEHNGIETRPIICGNMARQPAFEHYTHRTATDLVGANRVMDCGLYWGISPLMSDEQIETVVLVVQQFFNT
jgi:CDP-4-dehydro-6-deoxyglucose reductase, E1